MRTLHIADQKKLDAPVAFAKAGHESEVRFILDGGEAPRSVKVIKNTFNSHLPALEELSRQKGKEIADLLIEGDPEIDYDYMGKISTRTQTVYLGEDGKVSYNIRFREHLFAPDGSEKEVRDMERLLANMNKEMPLSWTGKSFPLAKAARMFAFSKIYQIRHTNGLTYDFLYKMAQTLEQQQVMMLMGAGPNGKEPLRLNDGSLSYRAFLMGRTQGESYRLTMHLTNLELKDLE